MENGLDILSTLVQALRNVLALAMSSVPFVPLKENKTSLTPNELVQSGALSVKSIRKVVGVEMFSLSIKLFKFET